MSRTVVDHDRLSLDEPLLLQGSDGPRPDVAAASNFQVARGDHPKGPYGFEGARLLTAQPIHALVRPHFLAEVAARQPSASRNDRQAIQLLLEGAHILMSCIARHGHLSSLSR